MAYNFPATYQPMYYQPQLMPQYQQSAQQTQNNTGVIWVQGEAGMKAYLVAPNTTVQLWDSENPVIYLKSADASGMPSVKIIDYTVRDQNTPTTPAKAAEPAEDKYITKAELEALKGQIKRLKSDIEKLSKKEDEDDA